MKLEVNAKQFTTHLPSAHSIYLWVENNTLGSFEPLSRINGSSPWPESGVSIDPRDGRMIIASPGGVFWVNPGDWVVQSPHYSNEFFPVPPERFNSHYRLKNGAENA